MAAKNSRVIIYAVVGGIAIYGVYATMYGGDNSAPRKTVKKSAPAMKKSGNDIFTKEDYAAKSTDFTPVKDAGKNAFRPLVYKAPSTGTAGNPDMGYFRSLDTDGEPWVFSGIPELNGVRTALLENTKTGESVFLHNGEKWKRIQVKQIGSDFIIVTGHDGDPYTIHMQGMTAPPEKAGSTAALNASISPVQPPPLQGNIGGANGFAAQATDPNAAAMTMNTGGNNGGNGGGRRGRRNRGGGGNVGANGNDAGNTP